MAGKEGMRSSSPFDHELPQPRDPLGSLPNTCTHAILEHFTVVELIGVRRVSRGWKDAVDWRIASIMRKSRPDLAKGSDEEQATLEFCRDVFREHARDCGRPAFVRRFTHATQGFAMCGDYFCWVDDIRLNIQLVFNVDEGGRLPRVTRYRLIKLLKTDTVEAIKPQELGSMTDQPLLMMEYIEKRLEGGPVHVRTAVICVKSGSVLWSTAQDEHPDSSTSWGKLAALNHTTFAQITNYQPSLRPMLCVRDVLTGEVNATKPIPDNFLPPRSMNATSIQLHPRRGLVYIAVPGEVFFFSATTANCLGRLDAAIIFPTIAPRRLAGLCFSESQPKCSPSARERFFVCRYRAAPDVSELRVCCFEYEVPTDEEIAISEAGILRSGSQGCEDNLVFGVVRVEIYKHRMLWGMDGPELNPMLKGSAQTETGWARERYSMRVRLNTFTGHLAESPSAYSVFLEQGGRRIDDGIPIEVYSRDERDIFVTKPGGAPGQARRHNERTACIIPASASIPITLTERYMLLFVRARHVYLFAYEPSW